MNWTITFIEQGSFIRVSAEGDFTFEDCVKIKEDVLAREFWTVGTNVLYDYRETVFSTLTLDGLRRLGEFHESKNPEFGIGRIAFLMKSPRDFGLARQYEMITEGKVTSKVHVFLDEERAIEWVKSESVAL